MRALESVAVGVGLLLGVAAFAAVDLGGRVEAVRGILDGRVAAIESDQDATRAEKKERRRLVSAGKKLLKYDGDDTKKSLKKAALAVKYITKAKSGQEDVSGCVDGLLDALEAVARGARDDALSYVWPTKTCRGKHDRAIGRGDALMGKTSSKRATNPAKAATYAVDATTWYWRAGDLAKKCAEPGEPKVYVYGTRLFNDLNEDLRVDDMVFQFTGALGGEPLNFSGRAANQLPGSFPFWLYAGTSRDLMPITFALLASEPTLPKWQIGDFVNAHLTLQTSAGEFDVGF